MKIDLSELRGYVLVDIREYERLVRDSERFRVTQELMQIEEEKREVPELQAAQQTMEQETCETEREEAGAPGKRVPETDGGETPDANEAKEKKNRPRVDVGKIMALYMAGRSAKWIADDMGLGESTVRKYLTELRQEGKIPGGRSHVRSDAE